MNLLPLMVEAIGLLPPERRWESDIQRIHICARG